MGSDALDKLRGRSRSGLPSPESEDISRRRDSRKGQQIPVSGLSSLARIYADETEKEETVKPPIEATEIVHDPASASDPSPPTQDNNHSAKNVAKESSVKDSSQQSNKDKQLVKVASVISLFLRFWQINIVVGINQDPNANFSFDFSIFIALFIFYKVFFFRNSIPIFKVLSLFFIFF